jgi:hypothetical protein
MKPSREYTPGEKVGFILMVLLASGVLLTIAALPAMLLPSFAPHSHALAAPVTTKHLAFDIVPAKAGGPAEDWPAYVAREPLTVPANAVVTVTIRNYDLGDAALASGSPLARVGGTVGGVASVDGKAYAALDPAKVAHTFTIPLLGLNVPIPGDAPNNASYLTVTFSFRTHGTSTFLFECLAPCGTGTGFGGPMQSMAYMRGTLVVQG